MGRDLSPSTTKLCFMVLPKLTFTVPCNVLAAMLDRTLFAVSRTVGWITQWDELIKDPEQRIGRPRQIYTGPAERPYVPLDKR